MKSFVSLLLGAGMFTLVNTAIAQPITVVSFNAENLFDTKDDSTNPQDDTYLPLSVKQSLPGHNERCNALNSEGFYRDQCKTLDWSDAVFSTKLQRLADVILAMPALPDVIVMPETENREVLQELVSRHLADKHYEVIQLDTSDEPISRGIDVGILTRLKIIGTPTAHKVDFGSDAELCGATRDIVKAELELPDGTGLTILGVHFPSGSNPVKCRVRAFKTLSKLSADIPAEQLVLAAGDFNFNCTETTTPAFQRLLLRGNWYVSPVVRADCTAPGSSKFIDHLYDNWNTWSFLDLILVRQELSASRPSEKNWFADLGSFGTLAVHPEQITVDKDNEGFVEPRRFDPKTLRGVSDHWPVGLRLLRRR